MTLAASLALPEAGSELIQLADPKHELSDSVLNQPGGFVWWYVDHLDAQGNGFVCIWSFGLPFLPGVLAEARAGRPQVPRRRPSVNLALYENGKPTFYLLQEYPEHAASWNGSELQLGDSHFVTTRSENGVTLKADIDLPIPRSTGRIVGHFEVSGAMLQANGRRDGHHLWSPACGPATVRASFQRPGIGSNYSGPAYYDRNSGCTPLDQLGIDRWTWGRVVTEEATRIYYALWPDDASSTQDPTLWGVDLLKDGSVVGPHPLQLQCGKSATGLYGMRLNESLRFEREGRLWLQVTTQTRVDDGPFYVREIAQMTMPGHQPRLGMSEWVQPDAIDRSWQRPFVRMRVHKVEGRNSAFLPLFSGDRSKRLQRLLRGPRA